LGKLHFFYTEIAQEGMERKDRRIGGRRPARLCARLENAEEAIIRLPLKELAFISHVRAQLTAEDAKRRKRVRQLLMSESREQAIKQIFSRVSNTATRAG